MDASELVAMAREVIDSSPYLVLRPVDDAAGPRLSTVLFAHDGYRAFYRVCVPDTLHAVDAVIYDATVHVGHGRAVYLTGRSNDGAHRRLYFLPPDVWARHVSGAA
jgi:hypothetical protein